MAQIKNLRDFLAEVQRRGRLYEFTEPIHKESELMPLYRVQTRGLPEEGFSKMSAERTDANHPLIPPEGQEAPGVFFLRGDYRYLPTFPWPTCPRSAVESGIKEQTLSKWRKLLEHDRQGG